MFKNAKNKQKLESKKLETPQRVQPSKKFEKVCQNTLRRWKNIFGVLQNLPDENRILSTIFRDFA